MRHAFMTILLLLLAIVTATAQQKKKVHPKGEQLQELSDRIAHMTQNTQRIMFIDSIVLAKDEFLKAYNLNPEVGCIATYQEYFKNDRQPNAYVFQSAIGNQCYLSQENNEGIINLYVSENFDKRWTRPAKVRGINDDHQFSRVNYPFMMADGVTLYFAAEGKESIGGYDIFMTVYDVEEEQFLKPENIGMPFNSTANDYMFAIDEYDNLGWFATDRNQPEGYVCVYTFIPPTSRKTYDAEEYTPQEIANFARISDITNTWSERQQLDEAFGRLRLAQMRKNKKDTGREFTFVINDDIDYHHLSDFKANGNKERYLQLINMMAKQEALAKALDKARDYYATAPADEKEELAEEIIASEQEQYLQRVKIHDMQKSIRNAENIFLTKNK